MTLTQVPIKARAVSRFLKLHPFFFPLQQPILRFQQHRTFTMTMQEPQDHSRFRTRGGGKRRGNNTRGSRHIPNHPRPAAAQYSTQPNGNNEVDDAYAASTSGAPQDATPRISVPTDTPTFAGLAKDNLIHPVLLKTISEDLKFNHMTPVQAATIHPLLKEDCDVLAQAKTGTGKTIAFLLPAIQRMMHRQEKPGENVSLLVISPTRELAMQIAEEARALLQRLKQYRICIVIGGTNKNTEERLISKGCDILIGTPGRLYDHLSGEDSLVASMLQSLDTLVLDEADRLLDMGFFNSLKKIVECLPDRAVHKRQCMLFSATVPEHVRKVSQLVLRPDYKSISTIAEGELDTHERVPQHLIVVPTFSDMAAGLLGALRQELAVVGPKAFKVIIFVPTARLVDFYVEVLQKSPGLPPVISLHSRMSQSKRTNITEEFRREKGRILVATDVIARGMDFPSVTNVFQAGIPSDKESYIHRLGRTARAGAEGKGTFIITSHETSYSKRTLNNIMFENTPADLSAREDVSEITARLDPDIQGKAYQGWLGYYKTFIKPFNWDPARLVHEANEFALNGLGAAEIPKLQKSTVGKMGLKGVKGLVIGPDFRNENFQKRERNGGDDSDISSRQPSKRPQRSE
ncbi:DEAD-domain-containing protein [Daldinia decipiens]|uniref:DEAD-domain-containing protein n=1 Tax=Daldinia decipiens TaxID=326647 RepID=UPI0020C3CBED|nr:DEAD-domain-containing protein [Daldinia decipiens]KAI1655565.1 DEAD-domain-containing protein [Daldinia decipiens]